MSNWTVLPTFQNEPLLDYDARTSKSMKEAIHKVEAEFGKEYPIIIGGKRITTQKTIRSINPSDADETVGVTSSASTELADQAIHGAREAFSSWKRVPFFDRAKVLLNAAQIMRQRRLELNATMVCEVGKNWQEADGDTAEAIDFLEFYAREMMRYGSQQPITPVEEEKNRLEYIPLGVGVIIPPWNFPCAILTGMTAAAIVTGNTVVLKPASDSGVIAAKVMDIFEQAGVPDGVINFLPGSGGAIGDHLVSHPLTRFINFTGSMEVGLRINTLAAVAGPGQKWIKRVSLELGGKDAILVDETADLESAADAIVASAFGFQGQKCSACSRAIIEQSVYSKIQEMVVEKAKTLTMGDARNPDHFMGPVINDRALTQMMEYIESGKSESELVLGGKDRRHLGGSFLEPTIFSRVPHRSRIAQEEIFGPILAMIQAEGFDDILEKGNDTLFGLTGSLFSEDRSRLQRACEEFHVGNLYLNRNCTGALVGVHPFGGFNMSGTDSKAGGSDYLGLFLQGKLISQQI